MFALLTAIPSLGQVMFRNDIILGKHIGKRNKGISFITVNMGRRRELIPGERMGSLVIDVQALRNPGQPYSYRQLAERVYQIDPFVTPIYQRVPQYLLIEPPMVISRATPVVKLRR